MYAINLFVFMIYGLSYTAISEINQIYKKNLQEQPGLAVALATVM